MASGIGLAASWVPMRSYFLLKEQATIVGVTRLRTRLTSALELDGGHIGYDIVPGYRRLGYGTELLRLTLQKAQALGLAKVILTAESSNIGSIKIIERNGGQFSNGYLSPVANAPMRRYIIDIANQPSD
jgi:predicted acetyltransferase